MTERLSESEGPTRDTVPVTPHARDAGIHRTALRARGRAVVPARRETPWQTETLLSKYHISSHFLYREIHTHARGHDVA